MPRLWTDTVESHRAQVHEAILDAAAELVHDGGPLAVTMSRLATTAGIGRATLYKYFSDTEAVLTAWHERQVTTHLAALQNLRSTNADPATRLRAVLEAYAHIRLTQRHPGAEQLTALLHRGTDARRHQLHDLLSDLITDAAEAGSVRSDIPARELASFCLHALDAVSDYVDPASDDVDPASGRGTSPRMVARLLAVIWSGLGGH